MPFLEALRLRNAQSTPSFVAMSAQSFDYAGNGYMEAFRKKHSSHPDFANLTLLVFEAVMEVVCVSLPGYIVARMGQFDAENQKFLANLNTQLFTPCLSTPPQACDDKSTTLTTTTRSLYQARVAADGRQAVRPRRHSRHIRRADPRFLPRRAARLQGVRL